MQDFFNHFLIQFSQKSIGNLLLANWQRILVILFIGLGFYLRIYHYLLNRSLWLDEAMLALNIVEKNYFQLLQPLELNQGAPILFLLIEKLFVTIFGNNELSLRLFPLLSGFFSLILVYKVGKIYFNEFVALCSLFLFSISEHLIYYSSEVKQYSTDVFATLLILYLARRCFNQDSTKKDFILLCAIGSILIFVSHPIIFSIMSISLLFLLISGKQLLKKKFHYIFSIIATWLFLYLLLFVLSLNNLASNKVLENYWKNEFMPLPLWENITWLINNFKSNLINPFGLHSSPLIIFLIVIISFLIIILNKNHIFKIIFILPFPFGLLFSSFHLYPFGGRLLLFLAPLFYLILFFGITSIFSFVLQKQNIISFKFLPSLIIIALIAYKPMMITYNNWKYPSYGQHLRPIMAEISNRLSYKDKIYVYYSSIPAFKYYMEYFNLNNIEYFSGTLNRENPENYLEEIDQMNLTGNVWFIFSHNCSWCKVNEEEFITYYLNNTGELILKISNHGASSYLYKR